MQEEQQRALELSEAVLCDGLRRQLEAATLVGAQLARIRDRELYLALSCRTFEVYCRRYLQMSLDQVSRFVAIAEVVEMIRAANLQLPMSETQAVMLAKIPQARLISCWRTVLAHCLQYQMALSDGIVRRAMRFEIANEGQMSSSQSVTTERTGIQIRLECDCLDSEN